MNKPIVVAIHQPNFFPWLGYFDKIARSDRFVLLDHVQFHKTGSMWTNRVKLFIGGEARWVTAPVSRGLHGVRAICDMEFKQGNPWREKMIKSLMANYSKAPFFQDTMDFVEPLIINQENNIARYNGATIMAVAEKLGQPGGKFFWSSQQEIGGQATEMLISLTHAVGGDAYMCGGGADGYQQDALFAANDVRLIPQSFKHPVYRQATGQDFVPGLSIIDALMYCGMSGVQSLLEDPVRERT